MLWCLGDDDQGRSVQPGGLAAELHRLADHDQVAAAALTVNRRQHDSAEREALASYRRGDLTESQAIRTAQRWEHDHHTPAATRDALAAAAVADSDQLRADNVAVLAVSHVDCEDLADRIRTIRQARGELAGPQLTGPGWGIATRRYAAGDRILFHTSLTVDGERFVNGTTGTIATIHDGGATALLDDGTAVVIPAGFVRGERIDGTPNTSHGWARTIDGAQGGTWEQVHLLATPNLDRFSAYVGQSRGRQPTHTWNTTPDLSDEEHGNVVADPRQPAERTLAAMARIPERRFAATDDPVVLDRQLRAERAEHEAALAAAPRNPTTVHDRYTAIVEQREQQARRLWDKLGRLDRQIAKTGGLRQIRPDTRRSHRDLLAARDATDAQLEATQEKLRSDRTIALRARSAANEYDRWAEANQWRHTEIDRIDQQLADHWTGTVLAAVHQDDPLAYSLDRLRDTRAVLANRKGSQADHDLRAVDHALGHARVTRIRAVDQGVPAPAHLAERLGPIPDHGLARDAWCALALHIERRLDSGLALPSIDDRRGPSLVERLDRLVEPDPLDHPRALLAAVDAVDASNHQPVAQTPGSPELWLHALDNATEAYRAIEQHRSRQLDHDLGRFL